MQTQDYILGNFQPSLAGLISLVMYTQDCVLGYSQHSQPSLRDSIQAEARSEALAFRASK